MVEANPNQGDGIARNTLYANWRKDKAPSPGYSAELISKNVPQQYFDDLGANPDVAGAADGQTLLDLFKRNCQQRPNEPFLGTRQPLDPVDGKP